MSEMGELAEKALAVREARQRQCEATAGLEAAIEAQRVAHEALVSANNARWDAERALLEAAGGTS